MYVGKYINMYTNAITLTWERGKRITIFYGRQARWLTTAHLMLSDSLVENGKNSETKFLVFSFQFFVDMLRTATKYNLKQNQF